uniref:Uncharacterized protein n=1 Tax=Nelumbo nucifera TaxID=4432 RepID=A0A822YRM3_NELNU|nr:TPA_asm: hypothetical protein HUJ06_005811 [Nelumbo nucifera]
MRTVGCDSFVLLSIKCILRKCI